MEGRVDAWIMVLLLGYRLLLTACSSLVIWVWSSATFPHHSMEDGTCALGVGWWRKGCGKVRQEGGFVRGATDKRMWISTKSGGGSSNPSPPCITWKECPRHRSFWVRKSSTSLLNSSGFSMLTMWAALWKTTLRAFGALAASSSAVSWVPASSRSPITTSTGI